jgi:cytosine/adenosine deaminase-related metal-dependent hydrolase|tara:strand:- start:1702 stop:3156 length:1455 start_codon:yes stop_codon:yes gene_type:complete
MQEITTIAVENALVGEDYALSGPSEIILSGGRIAAIRPLQSLPDGPRLLAIPALADAHNHARPLSSTSFGCGDKPLETWLLQLAVMPSVDAYSAAAASFARSLRGGVTSVMVHLTRPMGLMSLPDEAREIARAAHDVGVSIGFAIAMRDRNPLVYGDHAMVLEGLDAADRALVQQIWLAQLPSIETQMALVDAVASAVSDLPGHIDVQYGPTGVQWCTDAFLEAIAKASAQTGRRVHMHLLETKPQRVWADGAYPDGIVARLNEIGLLSSRLTLAHCVWARPDELAQIGREGARIAVNASSNLHLHSGIASVPEMMAQGVSVAMGLDGCAFDEDDDALRELRLFHLLNHGPGFDDDGGLTRQTALHAACVTGRAGLGLGTGGVLAKGMPADIVLLDLNALDRDAVMPVDPRDYIFARAAQTHIVAAYANGRKVLAHGTVLGVDLPALETQLRTAYRVGLSEKAQIKAHWPKIEAAIATFYQGCC